LQKNGSNLKLARGRECRCFIRQKKEKHICIREKKKKPHEKEREEQDLHRRHFSNQIKGRKGNHPLSDQKRYGQNETKRKGSS